MSLHPRAPAPHAHQRLAKLTRRARLELELTAHPALDWMPSTCAYRADCSAVIAADDIQAAARGIREKLDAACAARQCA